MTEDVDVLFELQTEIRAGRAAAARKILCGLDPAERQQSEFCIEEGFLELLEFKAPADIERRLRQLSSTRLPPQPACRRDILFAVLANRGKDPLTALACVQEALAGARSHGCRHEEIDALIEAARIRGWMGHYEQSMEHLVEALSLCLGKPEHHIHEFLILARLADLNAEVHRWPRAHRYVQLALERIGGIGESIHAWQLKDCEARTLLALGHHELFGRLMGWFGEVDEELPDYLRFRWRALRTSGLIRSNRLDDAKASLMEIDEIRVDVAPDSYEEMVLTALRGHLALQRREFHDAAIALSFAAQWNLEQGLTVPYVHYTLLEAEALLAQGRMPDVSRKASAARSQCIRRNLSLQRESIDTFLSNHGLPVVAEIETGRIVREGGWKDRTTYTVLRKLGEGGQGSVFLAYDGIREREVAIKLLRSGSSQDPQAVYASLQREVRALSSIHVPGAARLIACGARSDGDPYIVQEFVQGQSLRQLLAEGLDRQEAFSAMVDVADTLSGLHRTGLAHRDIKPDNIIVSSDGPVLVDFGLASIARGEPAFDGSGTAGYRPPRALCRFRPAVWQDCYAFGVVILECLLGRNPVARDKGSWQSAFRIEPGFRQGLGQLRAVCSGLDTQRLGRLLEDLLSPWSLKHSNGAGSLADDLRSCRL